MPPSSPSPPSFSRGRKWSLSLNLVISTLAMVALVGMMNYLAARHQKRWVVTSNAQTELSPLTEKVLAGVTNPVRITLYFRREDSLCQMSWSLLRLYRAANELIELDLVDYEREPGAAEVIKMKYGLRPDEKDVAIVYCQGRKRLVHQGELSDLDLQPFLAGQTREIRRSHFKGEMMFTSAILTVVSSRPSKAYFLTGHGELDPESDDGQFGYSRFAQVLQANNVIYDKLNLAGAGDVPVDCNLLIVAGVQRPLQTEVVKKIERYLNSGGRMLVLFHSYARVRNIGLEEVLRDWGVAVGRNVVMDEKNFVSPNKTDMVVATYGGHPIMKPLYHFQLYMLLPREVEKESAAATGSDAPQVDLLAWTSPSGRRLTDIRPGGEIHPAEGDRKGNIPLMAAVERGGLRNVSAERGATRMVVVGDSLFLNNNNIDHEGNADFAGYAVNWLLARDQLLAAVPPRPIREWKLTMTDAQLTGARWILMGALPGAVLLLGTLVWLRRRR
jgi:hypothetical protein